MDPTRLRAVAADKGGVFTAAQARECGFTGYQIRRRLADGEWQRLVGQVFAFGGQRVTPRVVDRALAFAIPDAVLAGASAARLHGIPARDGPSCLLIRSATRIRRPGLRLLRDPVAEEDLVVLDGLVLTNRPRTVFDLLRSTPHAAATELLDRALQQRWITLPELTARVRAHAGRRGAPGLVALVRHAATGARSVAERLAVDLLRQSRITGWTANAEIHDHSGRLIAVGDLVFRGRSLVVEIDGRAHHVTPEQFQRDRTRQNRLVTEGWTVLRFTWSDLSTQPERVIRTIRSQLARQGQP